MITLHQKIAALLVPGSRIVQSPNSRVLQLVTIWAYSSGGDVSAYRRRYVQRAD